MIDLIGPISDPAKRHEFVLLFDVLDGNPNGDPDASNLPRTDPETGHGIVTDVAIKRKIRDYLALTQGLPIFIQSQTALNTLKRASAEGLAEPLTEEERKSERPLPKLQAKLCADFFDIRMFGAVLATGDKGDRLNAGQVRGPVQISFARSIDPVQASDIGISRQARTTEERMLTGTTELGRKTLVPYGLYRAQGFFNPFLAEKTGVTSEDVQALWGTLPNLFEFDRSASRGTMAMRHVFVFTHENKLGNAPAHRLFDTVTISRKPSYDDNGNPSDAGRDAFPPRSFTDYNVQVDREHLPDGISVDDLAE